MARLWWHRTRRVFLIAAGALVALLAAGVLYQSVSIRREAGRFPPPGQLVDVGGRRLHLVCIGDGQPAVIFEPSAFGNSLSSGNARTEISATTRVCSYDRMGTGWSDPGPAVIPAGVLADDLDHLLTRAGIPPPYILVPSSIGGLTAELFARRHPERVAGLVLLDAATSGGLARLQPEITWTRIQAVCLAPLAARTGLLRLIDPFDLRRTGGESASRLVAQMYRVESMNTICGMARGAWKTVEEFQAAPPFPPDVPLTVLSAETNAGLLPPKLPIREIGFTRDRHAIHQAMARQSSRGSWQVVPGSSHLIGNSQPHAVAVAVLDMLKNGRGPVAKTAGSS
ncbi:MAG TPA: alpha/beta hydrolase [Vicinamibacterales bacterium]